MKKYNDPLALLPLLDRGYLSHHFFNPYLRSLLQKLPYSEKEDPGCLVLVDNHARASVLCRQCSEERKTCITTSAGMLGNAHDFANILEWQVVLMDSDQWNADVKRTVLEETLNLAIAFDCAESAHARQFGLKGTRKAVGV
ncbi:hypothetical protein BO85DRAFT_434512 [Aspergillus piperis CBS 112811]|uniref:Uncharacterized protein n=1 Tax=Aspergillus piperis CBS 112811 TaxID=1448313 RepID=A0A8G1VRH2_9EURO|nr:hypothetical protein BO85DRAFT_434512 [Aspergillus piperis CBS 112811]RAH61867.1 hypothetical protein BO85DRAFT_434512 [Aspergillus piperis CBS 112811]